MFIKLSNISSRKICGAILSFFRHLTEYFLAFVVPKDTLIWTTLKKTQLIIVYILENLIIWEISLLYFLNGMTKKDNSKNEDQMKKRKNSWKKLRKR